MKILILCGVLIIILLALLLFIPLTFYIEKGQGKKLRIEVKLLFFKFANDKKTMKLISKFNKKNKKNGKKEQKDTGDISFKDKIINTCKLVSNILNQASYLISHIKINHLYLKLICAEVDTAFTAITYGAVCSAIYPLLGIIESKAKVKNGGFDLKIGCDYDSKKSLYDFNITFSFPLIFALIAGIRFLIKKSG